MYKNIFIKIFKIIFKIIWEYFCVHFSRWRFGIFPFLTGTKNIWSGLFGLVCAVGLFWFSANHSSARNELYLDELYLDDGTAFEGWNKDAETSPRTCVYVEWGVAKMVRWVGSGQDGMLSEEWPRRYAEGGVLWWIPSFRALTEGCLDGQAAY